MQAVYVPNRENSDYFQTTKEQRAQLLIKANILDKDGYYVERFFSAETIKKDKAKRQDK
ncbi:MAG: hypothetical protein HOP34_06600 [Methylococcaceae bacterium]|nr:hypothetical protein [Methylococcaceae bacterium]